MEGTELLWAIVEWLPVVFAIDLVAFHVTGDHPLALRWWWRRRADAARTEGRASHPITPPGERDMETPGPARLPRLRRPPQGSSAAW